MSRVKKDIVNELHKPARRNFKRRRVIIKGLNDLWQADLADFKLYSRENRGYKYILVVIDSFSKCLWTRPLKTKGAVEVRDAMRTVLKQHQPKNLQTDAGKEFYNQHFKALMSQYDINHYSTYSVTKASIAERVIPTLKEKSYKEFMLRGSYNWTTILDDITKQYNNTKHRTIGMKPKDVTAKSNLHAHIKIVGKQRKFSLNDVVRISKYKSIFDKGYTPNWSTELFRIAKVKLTNPITYLLEDTNGHPILGTFYAEELQKAKHPDVYLVEKVLRRKATKAFVKWVGFDKTHNSWISKNNIL